MKGKNRHQKSVYFKDAYLWDKVKKSAREENRSVNNYIETIIAANELNRDLRK